LGRFDLSIISFGTTGIKQRIPAKLNQPRPKLSNQVKGKVIATPILNGLHHSYAYAAC